MAEEEQGDENQERKEEEKVEDVHNQIHNPAEAFESDLQLRIVLENGEQQGSACDVAMAPSERQAPHASALLKRRNQVHTAFELFSVAPGLSSWRAVQ